MFVIPHGVKFTDIANAITLIEQAIRDKKLSGPVYAADVYPSGITLTLVSREIHYIDPCPDMYTIRGNQYARIPVPLSTTVDDWRAPRHVLNWPKLRIKVS